MPWRFSAPCYGAAGALTPMRPVTRRPSPSSSRFTGAIRVFTRRLCRTRAQQYPEFEILFGLAATTTTRWPPSGGCRSEFPRVPISIRVVETDAPNQKVGVLAELARQARTRCCW